MKKIIRMIVFSGAALFITTLWDKGFTLNYDKIPFLLTIIAVALLYYIIRPLSKIVLLPLNIITFGLISLVVYSFLFYIVASQFSMIHVRAWTFPGVSFAGIIVPKLAISYMVNIVLSSMSVSFIINMLEKLI